MIHNNTINVLSMPNDGKTDRLSFDLDPFEDDQFLSSLEVDGLSSNTAKLASSTELANFLLAQPIQNIDHDEYRPDTAHTAHTTPHSIENNDRIYSLDTSRMSSTERRRDYELDNMSDHNDDHGIRQNPASNIESPGFVEAKLAEFDAELSLIANKAAFDLAKQQNREYIEDQELRLKFLRCISYDSRKAALRFISWCESKLNMFGPDVLGRDLRIDDLCPVAREMLDAGIVQVLPERDLSGRPSFCCLGLSAETFSTLAFGQLFHYIMLVMGEDKEAQTKGVVGIHALDKFSSECFTDEQRQHLYKCTLSAKVVPVKLHSFHLLADRESNMDGVATLIDLSMSEHVRHRFHSNFGSIQENLAHLNQHGIATNALPFDVAGSIKLGAHREWIEQRQITVAGHQIGAMPFATLRPQQQHQYNRDEPTHSRDQAPTNVDQRAQSGIAGTPQSNEAANIEETASPHTEIICSPSSKDILCGRGRPYQEHAGNLHLKQIIAELYDTYDQTPRRRKMEISDRVVEMIFERGGRFLKKKIPKERGNWIEVDLAQAREKVAHGFRKKRETDLANSGKVRK